MSRKKLAMLIKKSSLIFDKYANQFLVPYNLTVSQFRILMILYKNPPCTVRQADIEAIFSMSNPTVTGLIHKLENNGLVERVENPEDKRSKLLALTELAESKRDEFVELADSIETKMTSGLSELEADLLAELLMKLVQKNSSGDTL